MRITVDGISFQPAESAEFERHASPLVRHVARLVERWKSPEPVFELTTSGSTGEPKTVVHHRNYLEWLSGQTRKFMQLSDHERLGCCLPMDKAGGLMMLIRSLTFGWDIEVVEPAANPLKLFKSLPTFLSLVPYQIERMMEDPENVSKLNQIPHLLLGGTHPTEMSLNALLSRIQPAYIGYGMTETAGHISLKKITHSFDDEAYVPFDGVLFSVKGDFVTIDIPVFQYHFETKDIGRVTDNQLFLKGRSEDYLNSGGLKVTAQSLERDLSEFFLKVNISTIPVVFSIPDVKFGEAICVVFEKELPDVQTIELCKKYLSSQMDHRLIPKYWFVMESIPRVNMKADRRRLKEYFSSNT